MRNLAELLADGGLQRRVRESMRHLEPFRSPETLPPILRDRLEELDRVMAGREAQSMPN